MLVPGCRHLGVAEQGDQLHLGTEGFGNRVVRSHLQIGGVGVVDDQDLGHDPAGVELAEETPQTRGMRFAELGVVELVFATLLEEVVRRDHHDLGAGLLRFLAELLHVGALAGSGDPGEDQDPHLGSFCG